MLQNIIKSQIIQLPNFERMHGIGLGKIGLD